MIVLIAAIRLLINLGKQDVCANLIKTRSYRTDKAVLLPAHNLMPLLKQ